MKILIIDDHSLVREGLQAILGRSDFAAQYVEASDAASAWQQLEKHPDIDFALLDIQLPDSSGMDLLSRIVAVRPNLPIIMLSADHDSQTVAKALELGASGFIPKSALSDILASAIRLVLAGGVYVPPEALRKSMAPSQQTPVTPSVETFRFTARQLDVFRLLVQGLSNKQICRQVDLAEATVKIHVRGILRVLDVSTRSEAIVKVSQLGIKIPEAEEQPNA